MNSISMISLIWRVKRRLATRARFIQSTRNFFIQHNFMEVETPLRIPVPAPEEHIEAIPSDNWFLQTSPELCMKRLLAAGYPQIFQISKCFRSAERGSKHLPNSPYWSAISAVRLFSAHGSMRGNAHRHI